MVQVLAVSPDHIHHDDILQLDDVHAPEYSLAKVHATEFDVIISGSNQGC